jgi:tetratricopeptide (TPR) repeat protein
MSPRSRGHSGLPFSPASGRTLWTAVGLAALAVLVYAGVGTHDFIGLDDPGYVRDNPHVLAGLTAAGVRWAFTTHLAANWHPITWLSHMLDVTIFGPTPGPPHLVNVAWHALDTVLLFLLLCQTTRAVGRSAFVAALFAVHPAHVESVAWIAERKDVLSTAFWLLALLAYAAYARAAQGKGRRMYAASLLLVALGLMSKPMLISTPALLLVLDVWPLQRTPWTSADARWMPLLLEKLPFAALSVASLVVTFIVQRLGGAVSTLDVLPWTMRVENALVSYVKYVVMMVWPSGLSIFYPYPHDFSATEVAGAALALIAASTFAWRERRRRPYVFAGWAWFVVTLIPVIGLAQVGTQAMADRYTYVPYVGLFAIVAWGAVELAGTRIARPLVASTAAVVIFVLGVVAHAQVAVWQDTQSVWQHAIDVMPDNFRAHNAMGAWLGEHGRPADAAAEFALSARLDPSYPDAPHNLGVALADQGKYADAIPQYERALQLNPQFAEAHGDLGLALASTGQVDAAMAQYQEALHLDPTLAQAHSNYGMLLVGRGQLADGMNEYRQALALDPSLAGAHRNLGMALQGQGDLAGAIAQYREAIRLRPAFPDAHNDLGFALATSGHVQDAIPEFRQAIQLRPDFVQAHVNLALALGAANLLDDAAREFQAVLVLDPTNQTATRALDGLAHRPKTAGGGSQ